MEFRPTVFGNYVLFHRLANGGMAEVYLARPKDNTLAKDRIIVIKKILAESSADPEFLTLFKQEVSISLGLTHSNIVQTYDYGLVDGEYYLAMEYVPGFTLSDLLTTIAESEQKIPAEHAAFICAEVCNALAYTHSFRDPFTGKHHSIIHRDISPQNIMVGQMGSVKLFDFGIAKIEDSKGVTKTGMIRGKISYLSPEQASNKDLDGRSDLFTVGAVLWEALAGVKLFQFETQSISIEKIIKQEIVPPSKANRIVPKELDRIVLKALERDRYQRYQLAQDFQRDLHFFLQQRFPGYGPANLASYMDSIFKEKFVAEEKMLRDLMSSTETGSINVAKLKKESPEKRAEPQEKSASVKLEIGTASNFTTPRSTTPVSTRAASSLVGAALATMEMIRPARFNFDRAVKAQNERYVPFPAAKNTGFRNALALAGIIALIGWQISAPKSPANKIPTPSPSIQRTLASVAVDLGLKKKKPEPSFTNLKLVSTETEYSIFADGKPLSVQDNSVKLPTGQKVKLKALMAGYQPLDWEWDAAAPTTWELNFVSSRETGLLTVTTTPGARLQLSLGNQVVHEGDSPFDKIILAPGNYNLVIENALLGYRTQMNLVIKKGKTTTISKSLN